MSTKSPSQPTAAEIRAQIVQAEEALLTANRALGEALFAKVAAPEGRDVGPEQAAVDAGRRTIDQLQAMLPFVCCAAKKMRNGRQSG
jgi:hypothetical protein